MKKKNCTEICTKARREQFLKLQAVLQSGYPTDRSQSPKLSCSQGTPLTVPKVEVSSQLCRMMLAKLCPQTVYEREMGWGRKEEKDLPTIVKISLDSRREISHADKLLMQVLTFLRVSGLTPEENFRSLDRYHRSHLSHLTNMSDWKPRALESQTCWVFFHP